MRAERFVARCVLCGTGYTARSWYWLDALEVERCGEVDVVSVEVRQCAVPGCCNTLMRVSGVALALACVGGEAANDVR